MSSTGAPRKIRVLRMISCIVLNIEPISGPMIVCKAAAPLRYTQCWVSWVSWVSIVSWVSS
jgi:hypothetical protein